jgi:hypothetical protein
MSLGDRTRLTADLEGIYRWCINLQAFIDSEDYGGLAYALKHRVGLFDRLVADLERIQERTEAPQRTEVREE